MVPGSNPRENSLLAVRWQLIDCPFIDVKLSLKFIRASKIQIGIKMT